MNNEQRLRQIVREEILKDQNQKRFSGVSAIPNHSHDGLDSLKIKSDNIIPAVSVTGSISFATVNTYRINLNSSFTPQNISVNGIATGIYATRITRVLLVGSAQLTPTFYLQPDTPTSVKTGNIQFPFEGKPAQSGSYLSVTRASTTEKFAGITEDHIVSIGFPNPALITDIKARVTVTNFGRDFITVDVPFLDTANDWEVTLNFTIS